MFRWKSKGLSGESIITSKIPDVTFAAKLTYIHNSKIPVKSEEIC